MQTIMIVEDDPMIREELAFLLENENYQVLSISDFETIPEQVRSACPDLVLLDLGLPGRDGLSLRAAIRKTAPVMVVTSRTSFWPGSRQSCGETAAQIQNRIS